jgi:acetyltransferase-like isoleucine patch superfamily enzyme
MTIGQSVSLFRPSRIGIPMNIVSKIYEGLTRAGLYGIFKSGAISMRYTGKPDKIILHSKTIPSISKDTNFDLNGRINIGTSRFGATHPRIGRSKFSTTAGSSVSHTGQGMATIGPGSVVHIEGDFSMGDSYINSHSRIMCGEKITIGDNVAIAWNFEILDDDRHQIVIDGERPPSKSPIEIQDGVWIGHDVSVHKGVTIHAGSVIASDSVVIEDVPPNTLVAGSPAEVVRENVTWE